MSVLERLWGGPTPERPDEPDLESVDTDALDVYLGLLSNRRRRAVVLLLDEGPKDFGVIADEIASMESGPNYTGSERKAAYVGLYQVHMNKLAEHGIIRGNWHEDKHRRKVDVEPGPNHETAVAVLAAVQDVLADDGGIE